MSEITKKLAELNLTVVKNEPLKNYTTIKVGGPAKYFVEVTDSNQLFNVLKTLRQFNIPYFILGKGSNVVISDKGIDGFVILNNANNFEITGEFNSSLKTKTVKARFDFTFNESTSRENEKVRVIAESGVRIQYLMNKLFDNNIVGLESFAGIPCTLGGAVYMNLHGGDKFISDYIISAELFSEGSIKKVDNDYFDFDYDYSKLHKTKETVLRVELALPKGDGSIAKEKASLWAKKKSIQPKDSAGCVFKNLSEEEKNKLKLESTSIGYIIDKILKLKGYEIGGARISPSHAAFIENFNNATAKDIFDLHLLIKNKVKEKLNIDLETEIEFVGEF